tara:strand:- start:63 stop:710 length:648 start_codon:yes stop_codon:yes gene_type:complete
MQIDHFMYAVSSLDEGVAWAASVFDAEPAAGGAHVGLGTRNALLSLGHTYLELIAPDPEQDIAGTQGERFAALAAPGLVTWAARGDLGAAAQTLQAEGIRASGPHRTQRATPDGGLPIWDLLFHGSEELGGLLPFCIDWLECPHPSGVNPVGGQLEDVTLALPDPAPLRSALTALGVDGVEVCEGERSMSVEVACANGPVTLTTTAETLAVPFGR